MASSQHSENDYVKHFMFQSPNMTKVFGILGRKRAGKNTTGEIIGGQYKSVTELAFAYPLKDDLVKIFNVDPDYFYNEKNKELPLIHGMTPRHLMQWYGNLMKEKFGQHYWINKLKYQIEKCNTDVVIITDVRFLIETQMIINELAGTIIYLDRDTILGKIPENEDISEQQVYNSNEWAKEMKGHYYAIDNNGSIDELKMSINNIFNN